MNNHFGNCRFRRKDTNLDEFILVFPKRLKLPWHLKDGAKSDNKKEKIKADSKHKIIEREKVLL